MTEPKVGDRVQATYGGTVEEVLATIELARAINGEPTK